MNILKRTFNIWPHRIGTCAHCPSSCLRFAAPSTPARGQFEVKIAPVYENRMTQAAHQIHFQVPTQVPLLRRSSVRAEVWAPRQQTQPCKQSKLKLEYLFNIYSRNIMICTCSLIFSSFGNHASQHGQTNSWSRNHTAPHVHGTVVQWRVSHVAAQDIGQVALHYVAPIDDPDTT